MMKHLRVVGQAAADGPQLLCGDITTHRVIAHPTPGWRTKSGLCSWTLSRDAHLGSTAGRGRPWPAAGPEPASPDSGRSLERPHFQPAAAVWKGQRSTPPWIPTGSEERDPEPPSPLGCLAAAG